MSDKHTLASEGAPYNDEGRRLYPITRDGIGGSGRGKCSCGLLSDILPSAARRQKWHRDHKAAIKHAKTAARRDELTEVILAARWPSGSTDGFPTRRVASMIAAHLLATGAVS